MERIQSAPVIYVTTLVVSSIAIQWLCCKERQQQQQDRVQLQVLLALTSLSEEEKVRLKHKFDIAYWLAVEKVSFWKFSSICNLETWHGVNIGTSHTTETAAKSFTSYIAQAQRNELAVNLQKAKFFSLLLDGSTDAGNVENELLLAVWFNKDGAGEKVYTRTSYLYISGPATATALGIFDAVQAAVQKLGFSAISGGQCTKLVGIGTDGAAANIASAGLKGLVERDAVDILDVVHGP